MIQTGSRAIAVQFDVWGFTRLIHDSLETARGHAKQFEGNPKAIPNGHPKPE